MNEKLHRLDAVLLAKAIRDNVCTSQDAAEYFVRRIDSCDRELKSFINVFSEELGARNNSLLQGVPIAVKDNICVKGRRITCASTILNSHIAVYNATVVDKLRAAGLSIIGITNMDEFAFGSSTENSCYGPTRNPWNFSCVPGGSSGGSAAAVAARLIPWALGSDTGGSIRQPAALCGVVGFKPSYGRVSRYGLIAFGSSLDQIGPITTNFCDCAHLLNVICGYDPYDSTSSSQAVPDFTAALVRGLRGVKIGIPKEYFGKGLDPEVMQSLEEVKNVLASEGAKFVEVNMPHTEYAVAAYYIIAPSEASSNLQRFDGIKYGLRVTGNDLIDLYKRTRQQGFGDEAKRRIFIGTYSLSSGYYEAYYLRALKVRNLIKQDFDNVFQKVDLLLTPTTPTPAFKLGEKADDPLSMYLSDIYTIPVNLAGNCAVSFPCGFSSQGLPIGVQLIGKNFDEMMLLRAGYTYQSVTKYHKKIPPGFE